MSLRKGIGLCVFAACALPGFGAVHYRLAFEMDRPRAIAGRGLVAAVPGAGSTLVTDVTEGWARKEYFFRAVDSAADVMPEAKFSLWKTSGPIPTRGAKVERVTPVHARVGDVELGDGELIAGDRYSYSLSAVPPAAQGPARPLVKVCGTEWNTDRWCLAGRTEMVWRFNLAGRQFTSGKACLFCRRWYGGRFDIAFSLDGTAWHPAGAMVTNGFSAAVPPSMLPSDAIWLRLRGDGGAKTRALLTAVTFEAHLAGERLFVSGATRYVAEAEADATPPAVQHPWQFREMGTTVPGASDATLGVWTVSSGWKVPRLALPLPKARAERITLRAARNEAEAVQLVLSPAADLADVSVTAEGFPDGLGMEVWRVGYIQIERPTDGICISGPTADPLPPQTPGLRVRAGVNQPFWVRAKPAKGMPAGVCEGRLRISARIGGKAVSRAVPLSVEVFDFDFPDAVTVRSLFNIGLGDVNRYHNARTAADRERMEDIYLAALDENRLSPFRWTQYTKWGVKWIDGEPVLETADFDRAMRRVKEKYHFNAFRVSGFNSSLCSNDFGLGKASASETVPASLCGFKEGDAEYEARVAKLLRKVQEHFRAQGYLKEAIFYCFDEPKPDALPIVQKGYARLRKYAPDFRSIITAPVLADLLGGPHIWCPEPNALESALQRERQAAGDEFWTYVCMGPKAPWVTLFPDHPSVELRTWLWQSWAKGLKGVLIWTTTLWNGAARTLPKGMMQNPYVDAMSYRFDGNTYGNCDGRLFYPPFASVGGDDVAKTVPVPAAAAPCDFSRPVSSIRLEMLKDGIEDYEYLAMLRRLAPDSPLLAVPETIFRTLSDFNFDPAPIEARRVAVAREIVRLTKQGK